MNAAGVDPSLTGTGVVSVTRVAMTVKSTKVGDARLLDIARTVSVRCVGADLVCVEDLPTHGKGAGLTGLASGVVRHALLECRIPYVTVPPSTLKKYATGRGNATKSDMRLELFRRLELDLRDDNQVDAYWLRLLALDLLGEPELKLPATYRVALDAMGERQRVFVP